MKQLDKKAVWFFFFSFILRWFVLLALFFGPVAVAIILTLNKEGVNLEFLQGALKWLWLAVPAVLILFFAWARLTYRFYRYEITDRGFRYEAGVIYKKYVSIPFERIQNVDIYRGILARFLGLSDLNIQTAGSSASFNRYGSSVGGFSSEGRLPALSKETAEQVRDELIEKTSGLRREI